MRVTYLGHACILVEVAGKKLLFDPFITPNELASHIDVDAIEADYVLVSHGHQDHLADAESILKRTGAKLISNFEIVSWFGRQEIENMHPMNHGGGYDFDFGRVTYVNAIHSSMLPDGSYGGNPGGFVIQSGEGNFYFSGDTALTYDMKLIAESTTLAGPRYASATISPWVPRTPVAQPASWVCKPCWASTTIPSHRSRSTKTRPRSCSRATASSYSCPQSARPWNSS